MYCKTFLTILSFIYPLNSCPVLITTRSAGDKTLLNESLQYPSSNFCDNYYLNYVFNYTSCPNSDRCLRLADYNFLYIYIQIDNYFRYYHSFRISVDTSNSNYNLKYYCSTSTRPWHYKAKNHAQDYFTGRAFLSSCTSSRFVAVKVEHRTGLQAVYVNNLILTATVSSFFKTTTEEVSSTVPTPSPYDTTEAPASDNSSAIILEIIAYVIGAILIIIFIYFVFCKTNAEEEIALSAKEVQKEKQSIKKQPETPVTPIPILSHPSYNANVKQTVKTENQPNIVYQYVEGPVAAGAPLFQGFPQVKNAHIPAGNVQLVQNAMQMQNLVNTQMQQKIQPQYEQNEFVKEPPVYEEGVLESIQIQNHKDGEEQLGQSRTTMQ